MRLKDSAANLSISKEFNGVAENVDYKCGLQIHGQRIVRNAHAVENTIGMILPNFDLI